MRLGAEILLALIVAWAFGGLLMRVGGMVLMTVGLVGLALGGGPIGIVLVGAGAAVWCSARHTTSSATANVGARWRASSSNGWIAARRPTIGGSPV